jgi:hypothetical protein
VCAIFVLFLLLGDMNVRVPWLPPYNCKKRRVKEKEKKKEEKKKKEKKREKKGKKKKKKI